MAFKLVSLLLAATVLATFGTASPVNPRLSAEENIFIESTEDGAEEEGNAWEKSGFFEGDMILDESMFRNGKLLANGQPARFEGTSVPYEIDPEFDADQQGAIKKAFEEYHQKTCIRFRPKTASDKDWIFVRPGTGGCSAQVGRVGGRQFVNLAKNKPGSGCFGHGAIVHELLHGLGFYHQQSATERDDYVTISWDNIQEGHEHNFQKYSKTQVTSFGVEYDYDSIMHYGPKAFSKNGKPTIVPKKAGANIGQNKALSPKDIQKLHLMYKCPAPGGYSIESLNTDLEH